MYNRIKALHVGCRETLYLQRKHSAGQVGSLDLRYVGRQHLISVGSLSVEPVTLPWACSASSTRPLLSLGLASGRENAFLYNFLLYFKEYSCSKYNVHLRGIVPARLESPQVDQYQS